MNKNTANSKKEFWRQASKDVGYLLTIYEKCNRSIRRDCIHFNNKFITVFEWGTGHRAVIMYKVTV